MATVKGLASGEGVRKRVPLGSKGLGEVPWWHEIRWPAIATLILWSGLAIVTFPPAIVPSGTIDLDSSWEMALAVGLKSHLQFGRDIVFTYGPLGFLGTTGRYDFFGLWLISGLVHAVVHLLFFAVLALFLTRSGARPSQWLLVGGIFFLPLAITNLEYECVLIAVVLLHMALVDRSRALARAAGVGAGIVLGLLTLVKGTGIPLAVVLIAVFAGFALVVDRRGRVVETLAALAATFIALWIAAGQHLDAIPVYIRTSVEFVSGYGPAMGFIERVTITWLPGQVWVAAAGVVLLGALALAAVLRRDVPVAHLAALSLPVSFVMFKEAYVRIGDRHLIYFPMLLVLDVLVLVQASLGPASPRPRPRVVLLGLSAGLAALANLGFVAAMGAMGPAYLPLPTATLGARFDTYGRAVQLITSERARLDLTDSRRQVAVTGYGLPAAALGRLRSGTVDVVPWGVALVNAYGLNWKPRGVIESYAAYTPYLDQLDAHRYMTDGPDMVVFGGITIDNRYAPYDEPAFLRTLLSRYRFDSRVGDLILLKRSPVSVSPASVDLGTAQGRLGDWIKVPRAGGDRVYVNVAAQPNVTGRLLDLVFQRPEAHIVFLLDDGSMHEWRLIPNATDGLLISDFVSGTDDYQALFEGRPTRYRIAAFKVTSSGPSAYDPEVRAHFFASATLASGG